MNVSFERLEMKDVDTDNWDIFDLKGWTIKQIRDLDKIEFHFLP